MITSRRHTLRRLASWATAAVAVVGGTAKAQLPFGLALPFGGPAPIKPLAPVPIRPVVWKDFLGVNAQFQWFSPDIARLQIDRLKALGLEHVRLAIHWMLIEPQAGQYQIAGTDAMMALVRSTGLRSTAYLVGSPRFASSAPPGSPYVDKYPPADPAVYANCMRLLSQRYPQVDVWQVWNEPNILGFWLPMPDPEGYMRLLTPTVQALRQGNPSRPVALAGMAYFSEMDIRGGLMFDALNTLGVHQQNVVAAYHPYTPEPEGGEGGTRNFLDRMQAANKALRSRGVRQIWASEWGWSSYDGPKEEQPIVGEVGQASYTLKRLALMATQDLDRVYLFTLADLDARAGKRDRKYGLLREDGSPKPVYRALARFLEVCGPRLEPGTPVKVEGPTPAGLIGIAWRRSDGKQVWMAWANAPLTVALSGIPGGTWHQPMAATQQEVRAVAGQPLKLAVGTDLQMLVW